MTEEQDSWLQTVVQLRQLGRLDEALRYCETMLQVHTDDTDAMGYRAMLLYELERPDDALEAYEQLAHAFADKGDFLQALTTAKELSSLNPKASEQLTAELALSYQAYQDRLTSDAELESQIPTQDFPPFAVEATLATLPTLPSFPSEEDEPEEEEMLRRLRHLQSSDDDSDTEDFEFGQGQEEEPDTEDSPNDLVDTEEPHLGPTESAPAFIETTSPEMPPPLPPLFHQLDAESITAIWSSMVKLKPKANEVILRQGEEGGSFYIITEGTVVVTHEVDGEQEELGYLGPGQFFGEIALLTPLKRTATVTAMSDCKLLRLERSDMESVVLRHPIVHQELKRFVYQRLIHNLLVSSLIFFPLSDIKRWELAQQFNVVEVPEQYPVLKEGEPADGLYLVAGGQAELYRSDSDGAVSLVETLGPGQFFGELSLLTRIPSPCTMVSQEATTFLKLNVEDFQRVMEQYPRVLDLLEAVAAQRSRELELVEAPLSSVS